MLIGFYVQRHDLLRIDWLQTLQQTGSLSSKHAFSNKTDNGVFFSRTSVQFVEFQIYILLSTLEQT